MIRLTCTKPFPVGQTGKRHCRVATGAGADPSGLRLTCNAPSARRPKRKGLRQPAFRSSAQPSGPADTSWGEGTDQQSQSRERSSHEETARHNYARGIYGASDIKLAHWPGIAHQILAKCASLVTCQGVQSKVLQVSRRSIARHGFAAPAGPEHPDAFWHLQ